MVDQICRSASSIAANICEGSGRNSDKELVRYLYISRGSLYETKYHLILAKDLNYINEEELHLLNQKCEHIAKMLNGLINKLGGQQNDN